MVENIILAKIGGKILNNKKSVDSVISQFENLYTKHYATKIILIPGGGVYADFIRLLDKKLGFSVEQAHWMAIYAMNQNGIELCEKYRDFSCESDFSIIKARSQGLYVFLPYNYLFEIDSLPHSWQVTSDSIAMFIAIKLGLNYCYLIKDVDG
ncbi:MAG: hypothetical protein GF353_04785, partial [Candidatus Lokiarchaeota archaeon]|nr:hypothetical protein [Candidatus Lokiarchaeota archaeon]